MVSINFDKILKSHTSEFNLSIDLTINKSDFLALYGPSGSGKTSLLRVIAGLLQPDRGLIEVDGVTWLNTEKKLNLPTNRRSVGLVFQDYALFPNLSILENLQFGLKKTDASDLVEEIIELMELTALLDRKPIALSGGQMQRVALGRSLIARPKILMLDEPLAALDNTMRQKIQDYLLVAHHRYNVTTLIVSHDLGEIFKLANRVIHMNDGSIIADGSPNDVFLSAKQQGKFQFAGEVLEIMKEDVVFIITVLIGNQPVKVIADETSASQLAIGDKVLVTSKAFNPIIQKMP